MSFTVEVFQILNKLDADGMESICHDDFIFVVYLIWIFVDLKSH